MLRNTRKGFTLIELLIVVVIIGILAAIAIPKFANTKEKAYIAAMKSDLRNLVTAEEAFFADSVRYADRTTLGTMFRASTNWMVPASVVDVTGSPLLANMTPATSAGAPRPGRDGHAPPPSTFRFLRSDFIAVTYAFSFVFANFGIAMAARIPIMTTTIRSSISVKPLRFDSI